MKIRYNTKASLQDRS